MGDVDRHVNEVFFLLRYCLSVIYWNDKNKIYIFSRSI